MADEPDQDRVYAEARKVYGWAPVGVLAVSSIAIAAWLLWPGMREFPAGGDVIDAAQTEQILEDANQALRERADALRAAIDGAVCRADGVLVLPDGTTPFGTSPPEEGEAAPDRARANPGSLLPPRPARVIAPYDVGEAEPGSLLARLENGTVMVIAQGQNGEESGTGFFISETLIVTNHHVVSQSGPNTTVFVTSKALGGLREATIVATDGPLQSTGGDFALVEIADAAGTPLTIKVSATPLTLQNVVASGYPGDVLDMDSAFAALTQGDTSAVPRLTVTDGIVNTEQTIPPGLRLVVHSAPIANGNSGGPLTDMCANVVGVNTFVRTGELRNLNVAQASRNLVDFLDRAGVTVETTAEACAPMLSADGATGQGD